LIRFFIFILIIFSKFAWANCPGLAISNLPSVVDLNSNIAPRVNFRVTRQDLTTECEYVIGIDRGSAPNYNRKLFNSPNNTLTFELSKDNTMSNILKDINDANNKNEYISSKFKSSTNTKKLFKNLKFFAELTLATNAPAGDYSDSFIVKLYNKTNGNFTLVDSKSVLFTYNIPSTTNLSVVGTNTPFNALVTSQVANFGVLAQGQTRSFDVVVQTTNGYILSISSENNGKMKHENTSEFIDYIFKVNYSIVSLASTSALKGVFVPTTDRLVVEGIL